MKIIVFGGTGFVGRNLIPALLQKQYIVHVVGRDAAKIKKIFADTVVAHDWEQLDSLAADDFDVVINLAGENISQLRWTKSAKAGIKNSRVSTTNKIVSWCANAKQKKPHLYNTSALSIYGVQAATNVLSTPFTETSPIALDDTDNFLSEVAVAWEAALQPAVAAQIPVTIMRFAVVLKRHEGILKRLEPSFRLGMGAILGSGQQAFSWIDIDDLVNAIIYLLDHPDIIGPVNLSAPGCVTQETFAKELAKVMHKPLFVKFPTFFIKTAFGQMGKELLLAGQNGYPERLVHAGFQFTYPKISVALSHEWQR